MLSWLHGHQADVWKIMEDFVEVVFKNILK
jgi:hypothetical protein